MQTPQDRMKVAQVESERLQRYLAELSTDTFERPSAVTGWKVGDVIGHLCFGSGSLGLFLERALQGDTSTPEGYWPPGVNGPAQVAKIVDELGSERWARLGDKVIPTVQEQVDRLGKIIAGLSAADLEKPTYHMVFGIIPIRDTLPWWITEMAQHGWDFRSVLEPDTHLSLDALPTFMAFLPGIAGATFRRGERLPQPLCFRFEVSKPLPSRLDLVITGEQAKFGPATDAPADATFRCDTESLSLLFWARGRLDWDKAIAAGRVEVEGNRDLVPRLAQWFPGA